MQMEVIHSRDNQTIVEIFTGNAVKLLWKLWIDTDCQAILADEISVFKAGQMTGICTEAYSASECKCGWLFWSYELPPFGCWNLSAGKKKYRIFLPDELL